jgi:putative hydrolase of the HAD superfamily
MNFIFDIGNVLVDFKPVPFLHTLFYEETLINAMNDIIFKSPEWVRMDEGRMTHKEAAAVFVRNAPQYREAIAYTMYNIPKMLTLMPDTANMLKVLKGNSHKLYYCSNYHKELSRYIQQKYDFFDLFDGGVFSCDINVIKPNPAIYRYLLDKYHLSSAECIFFDDVWENVVAAIKEGIKGVHFTSVNSIKPYLEA